jgi:hypothetical protein
MDGRRLDFFAFLVRRGAPILVSMLSSTQFVVSHVLNELFVGEIINF